MAHVELRGFGWRHAGRRAWAVREVDLRIERGEQGALAGPRLTEQEHPLAALAGTGVLAPFAAGRDQVSV